MTHHLHRPQHYGESTSKRTCSLMSSFYSTKRNSSSSHENKLLDDESLVQLEGKSRPDKPGWRAMPYIIGNETVEKFAKLGIQANFMVYLMSVYNMDQVFASNILNTWAALSNALPVIGAFLADAYLGKFLTIVIGSFANFAGMVIITLTASVSQLHPSPCPPELQEVGVCSGHTTFQLIVLLLGFFWLAIGTGGISPCSIPFAIDQFDLTTVEGREGTRSFYNMYYVIQTLLLLINATVVLKIQDSYSWALGFSLPTLFMFISIIFFFAGTKVYTYVQPEGSIFARIAQVVVAAKLKSHLHLPAVEDSVGAFYDPQLENDAEQKLPLTKEFGCLSKAALIRKNELNDEGSSSDLWRLCSIQQVEELKCLLKMMPIWLTGTIAYIAIAQMAIFPISQALKMDRHLGHKFEIPAGSTVIVTMLSLVLAVSIYDRVLSPTLAKITEQEGGLTTLQRIGFGHVFGIMATLIAGLVEYKRRHLAISQGASDGVAPMSIMWLVPQFIFLGLTQGFSIIGHTEFFNKESPDKMRSIGNSLLSLQTAGANYLSTFFVNIIHNFTGKQGQPDWLDSDINKGRLDNFYYVIAAISLLNLFCFIFCARHYRYKFFGKA